MHYSAKMPLLVKNDAALYTLALQEARVSVTIENIIATQDELYKAQLFAEYVGNAAGKEVSRYAEALKQGFA